MAKYNITEIKEKPATYRSLVSPHMMDEMQEKIVKIIVFDKKYKDKDYSAKKLAEEIGTNTRYISAVVNTRFHCNFTSFINKYRIEEAMSLLVDKRYIDLNVADIGDMVGSSSKTTLFSSPKEGCTYVMGWFDIFFHPFVSDNQLQGRNALLLLQTKPTQTKSFTNGNKLRL